MSSIIIIKKTLRITIVLTAIIVIAAKTNLMAQIKDPTSSADHHRQIELSNDEQACEQLIAAIASDEVKKVEELLQTINPNCYCKDEEARRSSFKYFPMKSPLPFAAKIGNVAIGELLINKKANLDFYAQGGEEPPLFAAARNGKLSFVKLLIDSGALLDVKISGVGTALFVASENKQMEVIEYLLEKGANIDAKISGAGTPLSIAAQKGHLNIVKYLLEKGARIDIKVDGVGTPLSIAASYGQLELAAYLLEQGADIHAQADGTNSPLIRAIEENQYEMVQLLLENGADINQKSFHENLPPTYFAARLKDKAITELLKEYSHKN